MSKVILTHLDPKQILHPDDQSQLAWIRNHKGFETLLNKSVVKYQEMFSNVEYTGNGFEINENSLPQLHCQLVDACNVLGLEDIPKMSSFWEYFISSDSIGGKKNRIIITTGTIDLMDEKEIDFILGHEIGHIRCGHKPYQMLLELLYSPIINDVDQFNIASVIKLPLLDWYRVSHYSADRMGLLCCQDIDVALKAMIKMAGCPKRVYDNINIDAFIKQTEEFENYTKDFWTKLMKDFTIKAASMPWLVLRARKLLDWYNSGEYQRIIDNA